MSLLFDRPFQGFHYFVPTGHHVRIQADVEGMDIVRSYTPVFKSFAAAEDDAGDEGGIHLLYKTYPDGAMTYGHLRLVWWDNADKIQGRG